MRAAQIADLSGAYGNIRHQIIADKVHRYGLTRLYGTAMVERYNPETKTLHFVTDTEALSPATLAYCRDTLGCEYGIVRAPNWTNSTPEQLALQMHEDLNKLGVKASNQQCASLANAEAHSFDLVAFLNTFRVHRPTRELGWGIEGLQAGRLTDEQVRAITFDKKLTVYAENYRGNMYPVAGDAVYRDLITRLPAGKSKLYYDARDGAPDAMDGVLFTLEKLPDVMAQQVAA
jgi:hypothetical protein